MIMYPSDTTGKTKKAKTVKRIYDIGRIIAQDHKQTIIDLRQVKKFPYLQIAQEMQESIIQSLSTKRIRNTLTNDPKYLPFWADCIRAACKNLQVTLE